MKFIQIKYKIILTCIISLLTISAFPQESVRFSGVNGKLTTLSRAQKMEKTVMKSTGKATVKTLLLKDSNWKKVSTSRYKLVNDSTYRISNVGDDFKGQIIRQFSKKDSQLYYFSDFFKDKLVRQGQAKSIVPLLLDGEVTEYYKSGAKKSISIYRDNELISNQNWNEDGAKYIDNIFYSVDTNPIFRPGAKVINERLIADFKAAGIDLSEISGTLVIGFVITENGKIEGVKVLKGVGPTINTVAYNTFKDLKGDWTPARLNNQPVRYFQVFPINFIYKLQSFEFAELRGSTLHYGAF